LKPKRPRSIGRPGAASNVCGKLWLVSRSYASGIERLILSKKTQGSSLSQLAELLIAHAGKADALIARLDGCRDPLDVEQLATILDVHGRFVELIRPIVRSDKSPRSFVSKYLHFHCPQVPVYDTFAENILKKHVRWRDPLICFDIPPGADEWYAWFVCRFWNLYQQAAALDPDIRVKQLDYYLLWMAGSSYTGIGAEPVGEVASDVV
jgi:hypothetical protein